MSSADRARWKMPPGPAEPAAARNFATTASTRSGSSPTISWPSSSIALLNEPVSAPPKYVTPTPDTPSSVSTSKVTIGRVPLVFGGVGKRLVGRQRDDLRASAGYLHRRTPRLKSGKTYIPRPIREAGSWAVGGAG